MSGFVLTTPVYLIVKPDEAGGQPGFQTGYTETGVLFMPVFTEELFAERWIKQKGVAGVELRSVPTFAEFASLLKMFQAYGPPYIGFDPDETYQKYRVLTTKQVLDDVRRQAIQDESG